MTAALFMMWYDDNPKRPVAQKIAEGAAAYERRTGARPQVVLVNEADRDAQAPEGIAVKVVSYVRPHNYQFGMEGYV